MRRQQIPSTATKQRSKLRELSRCRKQTPYIVTMSRDLNSNVNNHCHLAEANISFLPCKEEDKLIHACRMSKSGYNTCKHCRMFSCLSHSVVFKCLHPPPSTSYARL